MTGYVDVFSEAAEQDLSLGWDDRFEFESRTLTTTIASPQVTDTTAPDS